MSMSPVAQPFHILRKDATHLWPETLVSIALLIAFAWAEIQTWQTATPGSFNIVLLASPLIKFLIPVAWLILVSRLVHDEELVGDRQFWITRPYTWYSLLLSKVLFMAIFICLPFLIMQMFLLHHAGLYPTLLLPALLKNLLSIAAIFLLPLFVIAAVTATFVRYISSVLAGIVYLFVVTAIAGYNWADRLDAPYVGYVLSGSMLALMLAALFIQYARRKTLVARVLLIALPLVVVAFALITPLNLLTAHRYPDTSAAAATFDPTPMRQQPDGRLFTFQHKVGIDLPILVAFPGASDKSSVEGERVRVTIDGPGGFHYLSDWTATRLLLNPVQKAYNLTFRLPQTVFDKIHNQPVAMHLEIGTETLVPGTPYTVTATEARFPIPGHAGCTASAEDGGLECRFAFANPEFKQVEATVHNGDCLTPGPQSARAFGALAPSTTTFSFSPVEIVRTDLSLGRTKVSLCPGTPTTFTPYVEGAYGRTHLDIPAITLDPYAVRIPVKPVAPQPESQQQ